MQLFLFMHVHGAAHRRTKKYPNGPMQVGVVSRLACAAVRLRVCANREFGTSFTRDELFSSRSRDPSPECVRSPWGRTPQNPKVPKWSFTIIQVGVISRLARASGQDGLRANDGFKPKFSGAMARSRRDPAICAVAGLNVHGAAHRRTQKYPNGPTQVGVVSRLAHAVARHRVCAKRRFWNIFY